MKEKGIRTIYIYHVGWHMRRVDKGKKSCINKKNWYALGEEMFTLKFPGFTEKVWLELIHSVTCMQLFFIHKSNAYNFKKKFRQGT